MLLSDLILSRGPISTSSMLGHTYFLNIVDDHNRLYWIFLMNFKSNNFFVSPIV